MAWGLDEGVNKPAYSNSKGGAAADARAPLDVPPALRQELEVPMPDQVAVDASGGSAKVQQARKDAVAGKAVSLDARQYAVSPGKLFSSVVDAMTALNLPVDSVDSPSGTLTTEWVRKDANTVNSFVDSAMNVFGGGPTHSRYRYVVRVMRAGKQSQLQVRTLGQQFLNRHWVNKPVKKKYSDELFSAVEERLPHAPQPDGASLPPEHMQAQ